MKLKNIFIFIFLLSIIGLSFSQTPCTTDGECVGETSPDPICYPDVSVCIDNICQFEILPNCCSADTDLCGDILPDNGCIKGYSCNFTTNQCDPELNECYQGQPCTDYCVSDETLCETRQCVANPEDPIADATCQINRVAYEFPCPTPSNHCLVSECIREQGCFEYSIFCTDGKGCTNDYCDNTLNECVHAPIENCTECHGQGCVSNDECIVTSCEMLEARRDPTYICVETYVCSTSNPTTNGETVAVSSTSAQTTSQTTISSTSSQTVTTTDDVTTFGTCSTGVNSEEYNGPKYPQCLNCEDLNCESMGRKCKYLKSWNDNCWDNSHQIEKKHNKHHPNYHHNNNNNNNNNHNGHHGYNNHHNKPSYGNNNGGFGGVNNNNNEKYPKKLGKDDCCMYTPTCY